jgi:hypothetical protein
LGCVCCAETNSLLRRQHVPTASGLGLLDRVVRESPDPELLVRSVRSVNTQHQRAVLSVQSLPEMVTFALNYPSAGLTLNVVKIACKWRGVL